MKKKHIVLLILFSILLKMLYVGFAIVVDAKSESFSFSKNTGGILGLFERNDSYWYKSIHEKGYPKIQSKRDLGWHDKEEFHQSSWGFMPGYPLATKSVSYVFNTSFEASAFILALLFSSLCFILFYWLACIWLKNPRDAFFATLIVMTMPFHYYFSMMYTEGYFFMLFLGAMIAAKKKRYFLVGIFTSIMVIIRANGLLMLLPIVLFILENEKLLHAYQVKEEVLTWNSLKKFAFLVLPILSFAAYILYQYLETGYPFAYSIAQKGGWYREMMFPLLGLFRSGQAHVQFNSCYAILFMIIGIIAWKKLPLSFNLIIWMNILLPLSAGTSEGMPRYISIIFPLFFLFGYWLRNVRWKFALIPLLIGLQLFTFYFWLVSDSFSY